MFCKTRTAFLGRLPARAESGAFDQGRLPTRAEMHSISTRGSLLPERLRLSAAGGNDRQIAIPSAEHRVHAERPPRQKCAALQSGES